MPRDPARTFWTPRKSPGPPSLRFEHGVQVPVDRTGGFSRRCLGGSQHLPSLPSLRTDSGCGVDLRVVGYCPASLDLIEYRPRTPA